MAVNFNKVIDALAEHFGTRSVQLVATLPRINFLTPMLVEAIDPELRTFAIFIEPMLNVTKYEKFNNNMGFVKGQKRQDLDLDGIASLTTWPVSNWALALQSRTGVRKKVRTTSRATSCEIAAFEARCQHCQF